MKEKGIASLIHADQVVITSHAGTVEDGVPVPLTHSPVLSFPPEGMVEPVYIQE